MPLIAEEDARFLADHFSKEIKNPVKIVYFTQHDSKLVVPGMECLYCKETREILEEVAGLSDKIELQVHDFVSEAEEAARYGVDKIPATVITGAAKGKVRFFGIPSGYEFSSLIEAIVDVSKGTTDLSDATRKTLATVGQELHIQVFVTPTWPYCPNAARMAQKMAVENEHIIADTVEATEFPHLSQKYQVMSVPKIVVNERTHFVGSLPENRYLQEVMKAAGNGKAD